MTTKTIETPNGTVTINVKDKPEPINNTERVLAFLAEGGRIMHFVPTKRSNRFSRGLTVAFKAKGGRIEIATAVQHRNDSFTKKLGTKTAIEHFNAGKTVYIPMPQTVGRDLGLTHLIDGIFGVYL